MFSRDHGAACGGPFGLAQKNGPVGNEMEAYGHNLDGLFIS
jgi:hypothetical protein